MNLPSFCITFYVHLLLFYTISLRSTATNSNILHCIVLSELINYLSIFQWRDIRTRKHPSRGWNKTDLKNGYVILLTFLQSVWKLSSLTRNNRASPFENHLEMDNGIMLKRIAHRFWRPPALVAQDGMFLQFVIPSMYRCSWLMHIWPSFSRFGESFFFFFLGKKKFPKQSDGIRRWSDEDQMKIINQWTNSPLSPQSQQNKRNWKRWEINQTIRQGECHKCRWKTNNYCNNVHREPGHGPQTFVIWKRTGILYIHYYYYFVCVLLLFLLDGFFFFISLCRFCLVFRIKRGKI